MFGAKIGGATHINEIESHAHLTYYHGHTFQLVVGKSIKPIKIIRGTPDADFELSKLQTLSKKERSSNRLREETAPARNFQ